MMCSCVVKTCESHAGSPSAQKGGQRQGWGACLVEVIQVGGQGAATAHHPALEADFPAEATEQQLARQPAWEQRGSRV